MEHHIYCIRKITLTTKTKHLITSEIWKSYFIDVNFNIIHLSFIEVMLIITEMKNNELQRMVIYPKDVSIITGKGYRQSLRLLNRAKQIIGKEKKDFLTFDEFLIVFKMKS